MVTTLKNKDQLLTETLSCVPKEFHRGILFLTLHGSQAYETNTPDSDYDIRGVCIPPRWYYTGYLQKFEHLERKEPNDFALYELSKFCKLAAECNPNIIELLYVPEEKWLYVTPEWRRLVANRHLFLSKKAKFTFSGYAVSQLKRIKNHYFWLKTEEPQKPTREEYGLPNQMKMTVSEEQVVHKLLHNEVLPDPETVRDYIMREQRYREAFDKWETYTTWRENRNPYRHDLEEKYGYDCYLDDTEFLTDQGWKKYQDITQDIKLASLDKDTFSIVYQHYTDKFHGTFEMEPYKLSGTHMNCVVTPNHRMFIRKKERKSGKLSDFEFVQASHLPDTFEVVRTITPKKKCYINKSLSDLKIGQMAFMRLAGWFLSEGSINFSRKGLPSAISISQKKGGRLHGGMKKFYNKWKSIIACSLNTHTLKPNGFRKEECDEVRLLITDKEIVQKIYEEYGHKETKRIPRYVSDLSLRLKAHLLDAMVGGDGTFRTHKTKTESIIYYSKLKTLSDDIHELAFLCGYETSLWGPYLDEEKELEMYHVHIRKEVEQFRQCIRSQNVEKLPLGKYEVCCFTVPNDILITRREGNIAIHSNTKHALHLIRLMRMCVEILTTGEVLVTRPDAADLLEIKVGKMSYDELIAWAEETDTTLNELYQTSTLQREPDRNAIDRLCQELIERNILKELGYL